MIAVPLPLPARDRLEATYRDNLDIYDKLLYEVQRRVRTALKNCGLSATLKYRVKSFPSFYQKVLRILRSADPPTDQVVISDVLAIRVVCPFMEDVSLAERCIRSQFHISEVERKGAEYSIREFGYESVHCLLRVPQDILEGFHTPGPFECELQLRTILQDAWAEVEHELVYKSEFKPFDVTVQRKLAALNANLTLADITFQEIRDYQRRLYGELQKRRQSIWAAITRATDGRSESLELDEFLGVDSPTLDVSQTLLREGRPPGVGARSAGSDPAGSLDAQLLEALQAHNAGDYDRADRVYSQIIARGPTDYVRAIVLIHRGMVRFASSRYRDALADLGSVLSIDPTNWRALFFRGTVHRILGDLEAAEADLTACLACDPYRVECLLQRSELYLQTGRLAEALADCEQALTLEPGARSLEQLRTRIVEQQAYGRRRG